MSGKWVYDPMRDRFLYEDVGSSTVCDPPPSFMTREVELTPSCIDMIAKATVDDLIRRLSKGGGG